MKIWTISKDFDVAIANKVFNQNLFKDKTQLKEKCKNLHGHNITVTYELTASGLQNDMVLDYTLLSPKVFHMFDVVHAEDLDHKLIISEYDPDYENLVKALNGEMFVVDFTPTAETMAEYLCNEFYKFLKKQDLVNIDHIFEIAVSFNETKNSLCKVKMFMED